MKKGVVQFNSGYMVLEYCQLTGEWSHVQTISFLTLSKSTCQEQKENFERDQTSM